MLPKAQRIANSREIREIVKTGFSVRTATATAHISVLLRDDAGAEPVRFGYIAGKRVGGAVVRNYAKRRFRELTAELIGTADAVSVASSAGNSTQIRIIWRLNPPSAVADLASLRRDIAYIWAKATGKTLGANRRGKTHGN